MGGGAIVQYLIDGEHVMSEVMEFGPDLHWQSKEDFRAHWRRMIPITGPPGEVEFIAYLEGILTLSPQHGSARLN